MAKICEMAGVREYREKKPIELHRNDETGRLVVLATKQGGSNIMEIDLFDLVDWVRGTRMNGNDIGAGRKVA